MKGKIICFNQKENPVLLLVKVQRFYIAASNSSSMLCQKHFNFFSDSDYKIHICRFIITPNRVVLKASKYSSRH